MHLLTLGSPRSAMCKPRHTNNQGYLKDPHSKTRQKVVPKYVGVDRQYFKTPMFC